MIKSIFKEIIIMIALLAFILIILAVLFYDYNPMNKVLPNKIAYTVPENVKAELEEVTAEDTLINVQAKSYIIDGTDLNVYKKNNTYNPNKENPFALVSASGNTNEIENTTSGGGSSGGNSSGGSSSSGSTTRIK